uniref:DNA packaging terminase subunit 2 n=1 Tax=Lemniscomys rat herpesvirus TaxID=3141920 RepID=A0AAU7E1S7_9VIRU
MNTLQRLCVVCSKCNECAMDMECLRYCDPNTVLADSAAFRRNGLMVIYLYRKLYPALRNQNATQTTVLSLYMEILIKSLYESATEIDAALEEFSRHRDRNAYYRRVLDLDRCVRHETIEIVFSATLRMTVDLATLNDVERLLCKINCVYGGIEPPQGLSICRRVLSLLTRLCGSCPVAAPEAYRDTTTCLQCYEELMAIPNQGRSVNRRLRGLLCDHVTTRKSLVQLETDIQTVEQDVLESVGPVPRILNIIKAIKNLSSFSPASHAYISEAEDALRGYNLFSEIPERIYSLSDYTYWSKTSEIIVKHVGVTMRQLNVYHRLCRTLRTELSLYLYGEDTEDVFTRGESRLTGDERLFVGSIFAAPGKVVDLITSMSIESFENNPLFNRLHENNEIYAKIRSLIEEIRSPPGGVSGPTGGRVVLEGEDGRGSVGEGFGDAGADSPLEGGDVLLKRHDVIQEVNTRKRAYLRKVSEVGYHKVMKCIKTQEDLITKLVSVNLVGTVILETLSKVFNGFIHRQRYVSDVDDMVDIASVLSYDDHLYVVNNLVHRKLPSELLPRLGQQIYRFINGPLFTHHRDTHPLPYNVNMAYACDNAGVLPHVKEDLVRCAEGTVYPNEWMVTGYMKFFQFEDIKDLNSLQKRMWNHIRELVLSVALYNETFGKKLSICRVEEDCDISAELVLTYNQDAPLILRYNGERFRSKDLYLLLYRHLMIARTEGAVSHPDETGAARVTEHTVRGDSVRRVKRSRLSLSELARDVENDLCSDLVPGCLV